MTGSFQTQPFVKGEVVCLYNGEIYNYQSFGDYKSDGECLIDLYNKYGPAFVRKLDGEFAIFLCDFKERRIVISSDVFKTKPVFYSSTNREFGCCTLRTPLECAGHTRVTAMRPNQAKVIDLDNFRLLDEFPVYEFNLTQFKTTFDDWNRAFQAAVSKRVAGVREKIFLGLSGGYDSGAICLELIRTGIPFQAYSILGTENDEVLEKRFRLIENSNNASYQKFRKTWWRHKINFWHIKKHTEPFQYTISSSSSNFVKSIPLIEDSGSIWLSHVCRQGRRNRRRINLSGMGADEIFSDYGYKGKKLFRHSNFGGLFPNDLKTIFPWNSFYGSTMESYLTKEEFIAGSYGIETRYPFLDKMVVQEFLNLSAALKNSAYKSVLHQYLVAHNYAFETEVKRGF
jgi:asparagine synthetase B (glutamine-hydrolysing)